MKSTFSIFALLTLALLSYGLYQALVAAPTEATIRGSSTTRRIVISIMISMLWGGGSGGEG